jgi:transglutaminase-like putative cysteine protease
MQLSAAQVLPALSLRSIRPIGSYALRGLASRSGNNQSGNHKFLALDSIRGYILEIDSSNDSSTVLNPYHVKDFMDAVGLSVGKFEMGTEMGPQTGEGDRLWFCKDNTVYFCTFSDFTPKPFVQLPYPANGVAVWQSTVYVTCQKAGYILVYDAKTAKRITQFTAPGVGVENLTVSGEELWICDDVEQTVYCLDRATGVVKLNVLTPFVNPTAIAFSSTSDTVSNTASDTTSDTVSDTIPYIAYAGEEAYIRDDPNNVDHPHQLTYRDRTFIHPLHIYQNPTEHYALSNGYLVEMSYVEELSPLDAVALNQAEWRMALPAETHRQRILKIEPIGLPFTEEIQDGQRIVVFRFDHLQPHESRIFGWKAWIEMYGIKYQFTPRDLEKLPDLTPEFRTKYLVDDDELTMDSPIIRQAAKEAVGTETNILRQMLKIRNYVYDAMSYGIKPRIDPPDVALERGIGSCGEYVGIMLGLARLNGIACRTVGRYKCPPYPDRQNLPLEPDFNHVWFEFYVPGQGWLPMESNGDDVCDRGPYPLRCFMGLPWYFAEMGKGVSFEKLTSPDMTEETSIGNLALNHIRFTILHELVPYK